MGGLQCCGDRHAVHPVGSSLLYRSEPTGARPLRPPTPHCPPVRDTACLDVRPRRPVRLVRPCAAGQRDVCMNFTCCDTHCPRRRRRRRLLKSMTSLGAAAAAGGTVRIPELGFRAASSQSWPAPAGCSGSPNLLTKLIKLLANYARVESPECVRARHKLHSFRRARSVRAPPAPSASVRPVIV